MNRHAREAHHVNCSTTLLAIISAITFNLALREDFHSCSSRNTCTAGGIKTWTAGERGDTSVNMPRMPPTTMSRIFNHQLTCMYARFPGVLCSRCIRHPDGSVTWEMDCLLPGAHLGNCTDISFTHSLPHHMCHPHYRWQIWKMWNVGWVVCDRPGGMRVQSHRTCSAYMFVVGRRLICFVA